MLSYGLTWPALATLFILPWYESVLGVEGHGQQHWLWPQVGGSDAAHHAAGTLHVLAFPICCGSMHLFPFTKKYFLFMSVHL